MNIGKNIFHIYMHPQKMGGIERVFIEYSEILFNNGFNVITCTTESSFDIDQINKYSSKTYILPEYFDISTTLINYISSILDKHDIDIIIVHRRGAAISLCRSAIEKNNKNIPVIAVDHGCGVPHETKLAHKVICVNNTIKNDIDTFRGNKNDTYYLPNFINIPKIRKKIKKTKPIVLGYLGRLSPEKDVDRLIWSGYFLKAKGIDFKIKIGGADNDGITENQLKSLSRSLLLSNHIEFVGYIDWQKRFQFLETLDVFCLTSRFEAFPLVYLEAGISNLPLIFMDDGWGQSELVTHKKNGMLVKTKSLNTKQIGKNIAKCFIEYVNDIDLLYRNINENYSIISRNFSLESVSQKLLNIIIANIEKCNYSKFSNNQSRHCNKDITHTSFFPTFKVNLSKIMPNYDVISFDIFDTLLLRPFMKPHDLFEFISGEVNKILSPHHIDFTKERISAEEHARSQITLPTEEITIDQIYKKLAQNTKISLNKLKQIQHLEISIEQKLLRRRENICNAYDEAIKSGKQVIIISDIYLPETSIKEILSKNKITRYNKLYVSSELKIMKHNGTMYEFVLNDLSLGPNKMLHIGDNYHSDIIMAHEHGIHTFHCQKTSEIYQNIYGNLLSSNLRSSICNSIIAKKLFSDPNNIFFNNKNSLFNGSGYKLGYVSFGNILLSFTQWLIKKSIEEQVDELYFLSRDGYIMKKAYDLISPYYKKAPQSIYLYSSRRCLNVASIKTREQIDNILAKPFEGKLEDILLHRFGINKSVIDKTALSVSGFTSTSQKVNGCNHFNQMKELLYSIEDLIYKNSQKERANLLAYFNQIGINNKSVKKSVVDIGYACSMQQSLNELLKDNIGGYYFITFYTAEQFRNKGGNFQSFLGDLHNLADTHHPFEQSLTCMFETIFSNHEGSLVSFSKQDNTKITPILKKTHLEKNRISLVQEIHRGALDFITDFLNSSLNSPATEVILNRSDCMKIFHNFINKPFEHDARLFFDVEFEDAYSGHNQLHIISTLDQKKSLWKNGANLFYKDHDNTTINRIALFLIKLLHSKKTYQTIKKLNKESRNHEKSKKTEKIIHFKNYNIPTKLWVKMFYSKYTYNNYKKNYKKNRNINIFIKLFLDKKVYRQLNNVIRKINE